LHMFWGVIVKMVVQYIKVVGSVQLFQQSFTLISALADLHSDSYDLLVC